jgi:hypothetical protein
MSTSEREGLSSSRMPCPTLNGSCHSPEINLLEKKTLIMRNLHSVPTEHIVCVTQPSFFTSSPNHETLGEEVYRGYLVALRVYLPL